MWSVSVFKTGLKYNWNETVSDKTNTETGISYSYIQTFLWYVNYSLRRYMEAFSEMRVNSYYCCDSGVTWRIMEMGVKWGEVLENGIPHL